MNILLFGKPTCGKGTLAKKLEEKGYFVLGGSDVLRENSQTESATYYKEARHALDSGVLISSELINLMMTDKVSTIDQNTKVVLDGYPRTIEQAEHVLTLFPEGSFKAFYVDISDEEVESRIVNRLVCKDCSAPFSRIEPFQPKIENVCDHCGGQLYQRKDDNIEIIKTRLNEFNTKTLPILDFLNGKIELITIPSNCKDRFEFLINNI